MYIQLGNLFNLKFAAKELERSAKKCEKDAVNEKIKVKRAIEQGNMEGAKIYAENVIRNKNQALVFIFESRSLDVYKLCYLKFGVSENVLSSRCSLTACTDRCFDQTSDTIDGWCCSIDGVGHEINEFRTSIRINVRFSFKRCKNISLFESIRCRI